MTYYAFLDIHWQKIRTNNPLERIMREISTADSCRWCVPGWPVLSQPGSGSAALHRGSTKRYMNMRPLYQPKIMQTGAVA
jgi:putative transposase